jgi:NAD(P)-dependent dehydrogenase (short-subunit alcohol dehydrogenase family)
VLTGFNVACHRSPGSATPERQSIARIKVILLHAVATGRCVGSGPGADADLVFADTDSLEKDEPMNGLKATRFPRTLFTLAVRGGMPVALMFWSAIASPSEASAQVAGSADSRGDRRVVLITGSTDGLGREVARRLAQQGAHVIVHGRNVERGTALVREIESGGAGTAAFYAADFAELAAVRRFAEAIRSDYDRLDVLVNNAGIWLPGSDERRVSADGHELHFAVNYLAGYLLTRQLLPLLERGAPSRVINVASIAQTPVDFSNVMLEQGYTGSRAYGQSKLAQILFTIELANELDGRNISVNALHPATLMNTSMVEEAGARPRSTVDDGADALMQLATMEEPGTGRYFNGLVESRANEQAYDAEARARLIALSRALTGGR